MLKKIICLVCLCVLTSVSAYASEYGNITSNAPITKPQYETARKIILGLQNETPKHFCEHCGPFCAAIYDDKGNLIAKAQNNVVPACDCTNHAEMNVIRLAQKKLNTYDLSKYNLFHSTK